MLFYMPDDSTQTVSVRGVDTALWRKFGGAARTRDVSIRQALAEAIRDWLRKKATNA